MEMMDMIVIALLLVLVGILFMLAAKNGKLVEENRKLKEIIGLKDQAIENYKASRVAVKDVIENFSMHDDVMGMIEAGKSKEEISQALGIPESKIDLIIKFDRIKKEHKSLEK